MHMNFRSESNILEMLSEFEISRAILYAQCCAICISREVFVFECLSVCLEQIYECLMSGECHEE